MVRLLKGCVFGPSCDGLDTVLQDYPLPKLENGDWLVFGSETRGLPPDLREGFFPPTQRLRLPRASTPITVAQWQGGPPRGPRAVRM